MYVESLSFQPLSRGVFMRIGLWQSYAAMNSTFDHGDELEALFYSHAPFKDDYVCAHKPFKPEAEASCYC